jgi:hypothetical protein
MTWQPIETAPENTPILIRYYKGGKNWRTRVSDVPIITQAELTVRTGIKFMGNDPVTKQQIFDQNYVYRSWYDGLARLITECDTKNPKNFVTHWMPLPEEPN